MDNKARTVKVWDPLVRIFHWSLVVFFFAAYISAEEAEGLHVTAGYVVLALVAFRVVWGFIGPRHARFTDFVYGPGKILCYLKGLATGRPGHYLGHNPAGGAMIVVLLVFLLITTFAGLKTLAVEEGAGPFAYENGLVVSTAHADGFFELGEDDDDEHEEHGRYGEHGEGGEEFWEEVHEVFANTTLILALVHILGAVVSSVLHKENLILSMITGRKRTEGS